MVAPAPKRQGNLGVEQAPALVHGEPVAQAHAEAPHAFHAADSRRQFRTEEPGIGRFVRDTSDSSESKIDRGRRVVALFEVNAIRRTTARLKASRGSEQYQATNSVMA
jgi:hypothetical protein